MIVLKRMYLLLALIYQKTVLQNIQFGRIVAVGLHLHLHIRHCLVLAADFLKALNLLTGILNLLAHAPVLHDAQLHVLDVNILLHTNIFFYKFLQLDVHTERNRPLEQQREFLRIQSAKVNVVKLFAETLIVGTKVNVLFRKILNQPGFHLVGGHSAGAHTIIVLRQLALMPEKHPGNLIGDRLHIEHDAHALALPRIRPRQFQHNGTGKILISQIGKVIVLSNIDHTPQVLDQASVRIIRRRLIEKSASIGVGVQHDLQRIDHR